MNKRGTGRTGRMMAEAIELAKEGRSVYVAVDSIGEIVRLRTKETDKLGIKIETPEMLSTIDYDTMTLKGAWPTVVLLVDHFALERRFRPIIRMYERFDTGGVEALIGRGRPQDMTKKCSLKLNLENGHEEYKCGAENTRHGDGDFGYCTYCGGELVKKEYT